MPQDDKKSDTGDDSEKRLRKLKAEVEELGGHDSITEVSPDAPPEVEEEFLRQVIAFERATWSKPFDVLIKAGVSLPNPAELDDKQVTEKMWEVINSLGLLNVFLVHTDHLSDRELYEELWKDALREELVIQPNEPQFAAFLDLIGSGSDEDSLINLKYYADDEERSRWKRDWPDDPMPDRAPRPYNRDCHLPQWAPSTNNDVM